MASTARAGSAGGGTLGALRRALTTLLTIGQTRLQLIGNELQIEKHRALMQLVQALVAAFCLCLALLLIIGLVLAVWWDQRVPILAGLIVLLAGTAAWLLLSIRKARAAQEHPFAATLAELQEDLRQLKTQAQASHGPSEKPR